MDPLDFLSYRLGFCGLPYGEVKHVLDRARGAGGWAEACRSVAERCRSLAQAAGLLGRPVSASDGWRWAACAYHAESLGFHLNGGSADAGTVLDLRRLAREMYLRSMEARDAVRIVCGVHSVAGYWRTPAVEPRGAVVLFNGLDSISEVELHAFSDWMLARGLATLALDVPASIANEPRTPLFEFERIAAPIADWITARTGAGTRIGAFGVSFGGHLVARALSAEARFVAGVAVSPCARVSSKELALPRFRAMLAFAMNWPMSGDMDRLSSNIRLDRLPGPLGPLRIYSMDRDSLFGPEHAAALLAWGGNQVEVRNWAAEHVGTSRIHEWLPEACDWLATQLTKEIA